MMSYFDVFKKNIVCDICELRSPRNVSYKTPTYSMSMQKLIMQGMQQNYKK